MDASPLLRLPEGVTLTAVTLACNGLLLQVEATASSACCPLCACLAIRVQSRSARTVADLPCAGRRVRLRVHVRRFRCETPECPRTLFAERRSPCIEPWARLTVRVAQAIEVMGLATCRELGARLGDRLGIQTSPTPSLPRLMAVPTPAPLAVSTLGIEEFALRRGQRYGTLLGDLRRQQVRDRLPDRQAETAAAWMKQHREIDLVSRERGGDFASAATAGAPQASQCADRFHLLKNLGEALEGRLARHLAALRPDQVEPPRGTPRAEAHANHPPQLGPKEAELSQTKRAKRLVRSPQGVAFRQQGMSQAAIADRVGITRATVVRWVAHDPFPDQHPCPRQTSVAAHRPLLREPWDAGCHTSAQLSRELVARGYSHS